MKAVDRTPEYVIFKTLQAREEHDTKSRTTDQIMRELKLAGFEVIDMLGDVTREVADLLAEREEESDADG